MGPLKQPDHHTIWQTAQHNAKYSTMDGTIAGAISEKETRWLQDMSSTMVNSSMTKYEAASVGINIT